MSLQRSVPVQLEAGEVLVSSMRRHGIILVGRLLPPCVVLFVPISLVGYALHMRADDPVQAATLLRNSLIALLALIIPVGAWAWANAWDWANDSFHITTRRVIRFEQHWWLSQTVISAGLGQIQNIAVFMPDFLANALNYGTLTIETAAKAGTIQFDSIYDPRSAQRLIFELRGLPAPPPLPQQPTWRGWRRLLRSLFPFWPQFEPDGSVVYHKHWYMLLKHLGLPVFLLALVVLGVNLLHLRLLLYALIGIVPMFVYQYANWVNDVYILTTHRIINIVRIPLIREDRREALLEHVQNVQVTIPSLSSRLLDMGDVFVETAGKTENFLFQTVHHPHAIAEELNRRLEAVRSGRRAAETLARRREIEDVLTEILDRQQSAPPPDGAPTMPAT